MAASLTEIHPRCAKLARSFDLFLYIWKLHTVLIISDTGGGRTAASDFFPESHQYCTVRIPLLLSYGRKVAVSSVGRREKVCLAVASLYKRAKSEGYVKYT